MGLRYLDDTAPAGAPSMIGGAVAAPAPGGGTLRYVEPPGVGEDVLKSGASGVARGVVGLPGMAGNVAQAALAGQNWLRENLQGANAYLPPWLQVQQPYSPEEVRGVRDVLPTSGDVVRKVDQATGGKTGIAYQPQTTAGEYANTIGEFAPSLLAPGSVPAKIAQTVVPAVISETAGQVAREVAPDYESAARVAGALIGGHGTARMVGKPALPTDPEAWMKPAATSPGLVKSAISAGTRAVPSLVEATGTQALGYPGLLLARGVRPLYEPALRGIRGWANQPAGLAAPTGRAMTAASLLALQSAYPAMVP